MINNNLVIKSNFTSNKAIDYKYEKNILLVDDNEINIDIASNLLDNVNCNYITALNGIEAIEIFRNFTDKIDLILMDLHMPEMDGYDATQRIREVCKTVPIIALTADAIIGIKDKVISFGFNDILTKPYNRKEFENILEKWINFKLDDSLVEPTNTYNSEILDTTNILELLNYNHEKYNVFLNKYLINHKNIENELEQLIYADRKQFNLVLHKLKSSAGTIGAHKVFKSIKDIEGNSDNEQAFLDSFNSFKTNNQELLEYLETIA
ncbi:MAG: response regulator [Candidatus Kapaibacterium sp.]